MTVHQAGQDHAGDYDYPTDVDGSGVTELVVHGWGGSGPAEVLDDPEVRQVAGSKLAGIWRGRDARPSGRHREAYFWGGLTSRSWATALWFLLLPFAFVNMAGWMALGTRSQVRFQQAMVRVMAFCVTATYLLFLTQVFVDQAAWQCLAVTNCRAQPFWHALRMQDRPYLAAALAALVPALIVLLLHLGTSPNRRWEAAVGAGAVPTTSPRPSWSTPTSGRTAPGTPPRTGRCTPPVPGRCSRWSCCAPPPPAAGRQPSCSVRKFS
ncbi:hypothetical protein ACFQ0T_07500 [Kitasatospora gansuensis]